MTMPPDPQPYVVIGLKEVYDAVLTLTGTVQGLVAHDSERVKDLADHETRLRVVEAAQPVQMRADLERLKAARWPLPTVTALAAVAAVVVAVIALIYRH